MSAYDEGFRARLAGAKASENPHNPNETAWELWLQGWEDQNHHLNARDEALDSIGWFG